MVKGERVLAIPLVLTAGRDLGTNHHLVANALG